MRCRSFGVIAGMCLLLFLTGSIFGQTFLTHKDLAFAQVAAGGGYDTVLNVTNRGSATYAGWLYFFQGNRQVWNPTVNGTPVSGGIMNITIPAGATQTYRVTSGTSIEAGFAFFYAGSDANTNFIEGNLTYHVRSGSTLLESVGVQPSSEFYLAALPFDDFSTIALALANGDPSVSSNITVKVINEANALVGTTPITLGSASHTARFLTELFPSVHITRGRIEISADQPLLGTALTVNAGTISSLPLQGSPRSYHFDAISGTVTSRGDMSLWVDGFFVRGYLRVTEFDGSTITPITYFLVGRLINGVLRANWYGSGAPYYNEEVYCYARFSPFSTEATSATGTYYATFISDLTSVIGSFQLTRTN
ncbi:MAG: hypothetical protein PHX83_04095 [Acidobacteriia bacterium]|nr:hypothetical protein [Terriglobia bacterium]